MLSVSIKPLSLSCHFMVIHSHNVQIHFPLNSLPASGDLRIAVGSGCKISLSHLMIWNSISPCTETRRATEALQKGFEDTPSELIVWVYICIIKISSCYLFLSVPLLLSLSLARIGCLNVVWSTLPRFWLLSSTQRIIIMFNWTQIEFKCFIYINKTRLACQFFILSCPFWLFC